LEDTRQSVQAETTLGVWYRKFSRDDACYLARQADSNQNEIARDIRDAGRTLFLGDDVIYPHLSRLAAASFRGSSFQRERPRTQSAFHYEDTDYARYDGTLHFDPDVTLVTSASSEEISLVPSFSDALSVDTYSSRRFSFCLPGH